MIIKLKNGQEFSIKQSDLSNVKRGNSGLLTFEKKVGAPHPINVRTIEEMTLETGDGCEHLKGYIQANIDEFAKVDGGEE